MTATTLFFITSNSHIMPMHITWMLCVYARIINSICPWCWSIVSRIVSFDLIAASVFSALLFFSVYRLFDWKFTCVFLCLCLSLSLFFCGIIYFNKYLWFIYIATLFASLPILCRRNLRSRQKMAEWISIEKSLTSFGVNQTLQFFFLSRIYKYQTYCHRFKYRIAKQFGWPSEHFSHSMTCIFAGCLHLFAV